MFSLRKLFGMKDKSADSAPLKKLNTLEEARSFPDSYWAVFIEPREVLTVPVSMIRCDENALAKLRDEIFDTIPKVEDTHFDPHYKPSYRFVLKSEEMEARKRVEIATKKNQLPVTGGFIDPRTPLLDELWIDQKFEGYKQRILDVLSGKSN